MPMIQGVTLTDQQVQVYNSLYAQGGDYRATAIRMLESFRSKQGVPQQSIMGPPAPMGPIAPQKPVMGPVQLLPGETKAQYNARVSQQRQQGYSERHTTTTLDIKGALAGPAPARGTYQATPGGPLLISSEEENIRRTAEQKIPETPYKQKFGYTPSDTGYSSEIQNISNELSQQRTFLGQVQSAQKGTTFTINGKQYTQDESISYINKSISDLTESKVYMQRYQEAGYIYNKTDKGYSFSLPKASDVVTKVYGREPTDVYIASELRTLGFGVLFAGGQQLITGQKSLEAHKEETAEAILGTTRAPGESVQAYTARFWTSPEAIADVWLPVATLGVSKGITTAGRIFAPEIASIGSKLAGIGAKGARVIEYIPESARYVGFRAGFAGKTALYETGRVLSKPIGQQAVKYGLYGAMAGPELAETAMTRPELFGARLGQSLTRYEVGMGTFEAGGRILQKGFKEMREPMFMQQRPFAERHGLRPMGEEGTQPLPGAKRLISTKGMTEEERFAFEYKEPPLKITAEERESEALARSLEKKKPSRFQEFIKSEEGTQPLLPSIGPRAGLTEKRGFKELVKSEETTQPLPGIRPKELGPAPRKEVFFSEEAGRTTTVDIYEPYPKAQVLTEKTGRGMATTIEEYPRAGGLDILEGTKPGVRLEIPTSYEKEVTQLGAGKRRLDLIEAQPGQPTGKLIAEESKKGTLTIAEFKPGEQQQFEGLMGVRRVTPVSKYGMGKNEPSLMETMPVTKEQAREYQSQRLTEHVGFVPKEGWKKGIQNYYKETSEGLLKPYRGELAGEKGVYALDKGAEEKLFYEEIAQGKKGYTFDIGRSGVGIKSTMLDKGKPLRPGAVTQQPGLKEKVSKLLWEDKATPELRATYIGTRGRTAVRMMEEPPTRPGVRPKEGWKEYLGMTSKAEPETLRYADKMRRQMKLEKTEPLKPSGPSTPFKYERATGPSTETVIAKEIRPTPTGNLGTVNVTETKPLAEATTVKPTGLYESPNIKYVTVQRPLSREEVNILMGPGSETVGTSSRYWENIRPKMERGLHLLSSIKEKEFISTEGGLASSLKFTSGLEGEGLGAMTINLQDIGKERISEQKSEQLPDLLRGTISSQRYDRLLGQRQEQAQQQKQKQALALRQAQRYELLQEQEPVEDYMRMTIQEPVRETFGEGGLLNIPETSIKPPRPLPRRKPSEEAEEEYKRKKPAHGNAFDVYVKERGMYHGKVRKGFKFAKVNRQPLTEQDAMNLGGDITDNTSAVSFRLKKVKGTPQRPDRMLQPFSQRQNKFYKQGDTHIEKPEYRMDTPGELQQVSALGQQERRGRQKESLYQPVKTPHNKSTFLLSRNNKFTRTGLFSKKNKGGRKNDYY